MRPCQVGAIALATVPADATLCCRESTAHKLAYCSANRRIAHHARIVIRFVHGMSAAQPLSPPSLLSLLAPSAAYEKPCAHPGEITEAFKRHGINARAKRLYLELGDALIQPLSFHLSCLTREYARREAIAFLHLIQAGEMDVPPPRELVEAIGRLQLAQPAIEKLPAYLFRALWKECAQRLYRQEALGDWLQNEAIPIVEWFVRTNQDRHTDANQRRASWNSFSQRWEEWAYGSARPDGTRSWPALMKRFESGPFLFMELHHERDLHAEGVAMEHCVGAWVAECLTEDVHLYSIRTRRGDERLATMAIARSNAGWEVIQLKGPRNQSVSALINEFVAIFLSGLHAFGPRT